MKIGYLYNFVLFVYLCFQQGLLVLFEPEDSPKVLLDRIFDMYPYLTTIGLLLAVAVLVFWGGKLVQILWNKMIADIFCLRSVSFHEALSLVLVCTILFQR